MSDVAAPHPSTPARSTTASARVGSRPWVGGVATVLGAYLVLTAALVGLGSLIVDELSGVRRWDISVNRWFVRGRSAGFDSATAVGSHLAETLTVIALGLVVVFVLWRLHDRWSTTLVVVALGLEVAVFLTTTLLVDRHRPPVPRLDGAPPTSSFPSGHTAAACALYLGLVVILNRGHRRRAWRIAVSVVLALVPVAVGLSRLYRGMHHPTDVFAGALLGLACLAVAWRVSDMTAEMTTASPNPTVASTRPDPEESIA